jgi:hypothetical protein
MQMGSQMKEAKSQQQIANALKRWQQKAKKNQKVQSNSYSGFQSRSMTPSHGSSPLYLLRRENTTGHIETPEIYPRYYYSQYKASDVEMDLQYNSQSTNQHPISNPAETSNMEIVASSPYPGQASKTVLFTDTPGTKQLLKKALT